MIMVSFGRYLGILINNFLTKFFFAVPSTATSTSLSIATQTDDPVHNCDTCGDQLQCWNCDNSITSLRRPSAGTNKAELLLQAIRRTGNANVRPEANCDYDNNNR